VDTNLMLFSSVTLSLYNVLLKRFPQKLLSLFWASLFPYFRFIGIYLLRTFVLQHDLNVINVIHELIFNYTIAWRFFHH
jgi:hypothetical protein